MKLYIQDGVPNFYQYQIHGTDKHGRSVTLYAKNDTDKTNILATLNSTTVTNIAPDTTSQSKANAWKIDTGTSDFSIEDVLNYIQQSPTSVKLSAYSNLQTAINVVAANGTVIVDQDVDITSYAPLTLPSGITLMGDVLGRKITNTSTTAQHIVATGTSNVTVKTLTFVGAGSGTSGGIYFKTSSSNLIMKDVTINQTANYALSLDSSTNASLTNVNVSASGGQGILLNSGSTASLVSCSVSGCPETGYYFSSVSHITLSSCQAQSCGIGFDFESCDNISSTLCSTSNSVNTSTSYPGYGILLDGASGGTGNTISTFSSTDDAGYGIYCSTGTATINNFTQTKTTTTPVGSLYVGANVNFITINSMNVISPTSLASGKYSLIGATGASTAKNTLDDGQGNATINGVLNVESGVTYKTPNATHSFTWQYNPTTNSMDLVYQ